MASAVSSVAKPPQLRRSKRNVLGRALLSLFFRSLKDLSDEEIGSEPAFRNSLRIAGQAALSISVGVLLFGLGLLLGVGSVLERFRLGPDWVGAIALLSKIALWSGFGVVTLGLLTFGISAVSLRVVLQVRSRAALEADAKRVGDPAFRDVERIRKERMSLEERLFQRNLLDEFVLKAFEWRGVSFFEDGGYRFAPRVNVLLGKNGYGKTLLLRTLSAVMQRDPEYSGLLFTKAKSSSAASDASSGRLRVEVTRNGDTEEIIRDATYFDDHKAPVGKIPILAIPDSRFLNRSVRTVGGAPSTSEPLAASGARNYLTQEPFQNVVQDLLTQLCIDYLEGGGGTKGFERQVFRLVQEVVAELTEDPEFRFADIKRVGTSGFEILVRTTGSQGEAIPIQAASQGTLSIVAIFGLIHSFLHSLRPKLSEQKIPTVTATVVIDEIDAHLHPSWQQKILGMLTRKFPNTQFIVSAHSPAIVAGCDKGEVSVLRRRPETGKFYVDTLPEDFLGANLQDLYKRAFEVEDVDRLYLEYAAKLVQGNEERDREIDRLERKTRRSAQEDELLSRFHRESRLIKRADEAREQRLSSARNRAQIAMLDSEIERLRYDLKEKEKEIERLKSARDESREAGHEPRVPG
jgi:predicted ATPase